LPALLLRRLPQQIEDSMLGLAAGMMLAASAFSLLLPGLEAGASLLGHRGSGAAVVVFGMALGVLLMLGLDEFTPHAHDQSGPCGPGYEICGRVWLFVFAIALHNLPEGMAIGVSFSQGDMGVGTRLHEMEEGAGRKAFLASGRGAKQPIPAHHRNAGDQAQ
jgi:ZIP family zinc transporter